MTDQIITPEYQEEKEMREENGFQGKEQAVQLYNEPKSVHVSDHASIDDLKDQVQVIQQAMKSVMKNDEHFGVIPGTNKPTLLKPGAEKLSLLFRLAPKYAVDRFDMENGHREYEVRCTLVHINTGNFIGEGVGSCSTMEKKYRYRKAGRVCPECGEESIIKGKKEYGGGWLCFQKKGGCGKKWKDGAKEIESQSAGQVENPDIADAYNTVLKMAKKRAHVDAILTATAASDIFTQDVEDMPEFSESNKSPEKSSKPEKKPSKEASKKDTEKKWLNEGMDDWMKAEGAIKAGEIEPWELRKRYKVNKANMEYFKTLKADATAEMDKKFEEEELPF